jgi:1-acyl-sn-glycerol-3-phosphate acyltransferase
MTGIAQPANLPLDPNEASFRAFYADRDTRPPRKARAILLAAASGLLVTAGAIVLLPIGLVTLFQARRLYAAVAAILSRAILRLHGIRLIVHGAPFPRTQAIYISNHTSTLDVFVLVALGLPRTRFFLSGFLRRIVPFGVISWMMGTFFTVPQSRPRERARIFQGAERVLRRTGESVYLSPEGGRVTTGRLGPFNKGAFHLASNLRAPIVPLYIDIPADVDPRRGFDARPGTVHVHRLQAIDTMTWRLEDLAANTRQARDVLASFEESLRCAR